MAVPPDSTILAVQTEVGLEDLAAEDEEGFSADTVVALEQYASKVSTQSPRQQGLSCPPPLVPARTSPLKDTRAAPHLGTTCATPFIPLVHLLHVLVWGVQHSPAAATGSCLYSPLFTLPLQRESCCTKQQHPCGGKLGLASLWLLRYLLCYLGKPQPGT